MQNMGAAEDRHRLPRLLRVPPVAQGRGYAPRLLYFAAVQQARACYVVPKKASSAYWSE
jgi:hypothetical protein